MSQQRQRALVSDKHDIVGAHESYARSQACMGAPAFIRVRIPVSNHKINDTVSERAILTLS